MSTERLQKVLARAGVASRRASEELIREGRVRVNGQVISQLGTKVDPERDEIHVDGRPVRAVTAARQDKVYILLNKPPGVVTTTRDDRGRQTVVELVSQVPGTRLFPVGRLDFDAEGALLLTNDGALAHKLTHPRFDVPKTYHAKVKGRPTEEALDKLRKGIYLEDGPTRPADAEIIRAAKVNTWVEITITEGRNRLVKRMFWRIGHPVLKLVRAQFGNLRVDDLRVGHSRPLTKKELSELKSLTR